MDANPLILIVKTLGEIYVFILLLRFLLQLARADYYNPISQGVVRLTQPPLSPLQKMLPKIGRMDISPILLAIVVKALIILAIFAIANISMPVVNIAIYTLVGSLYSFLDIIFYATIGSVIISWVAPGSYHPAPQLIQQVTQPIFEAIQKVIPPLGGLDLSPIFILLGIQIVQSFLRPMVV